MRLVREMWVRLLLVSELGGKLMSMSLGSFFIFSLSSNLTCSKKGSCLGIWDAKLLVTTSSGILLQLSSVGMEWDLVGDCMIFLEGLQDPALPVPELVVPHVAKHTWNHVRRADT